MVYDIDKEKINVFVKNYFKSFRIKRFLILTLLCIVSTYLKGGKEAIGISMLVVIVMIFIIFFVVPDLLRKETEESIQDFYNDTSKYDKKLILVCNLRKFNGPTFGALHIDKKFMEFSPFRENLQNERFLINENEMKNIKISLYETKSSLFNRLFFKELCKSINISYGGKKVILQTSEPEKAIKKIREEIYGS